MNGHEVTRRLERWREGEREAFDELLPLVHSELKRIAAGCLCGERSGRTLQVTALVHEAYLRMADYRQPGFESRKHFYVVAARAMRRILIDHAPRRHAARREAAMLPAAVIALPPDVDFLTLDTAMRRLEAIDPEKARIVELRYFTGLSVPEIAEITGVSAAAVKRQWAIAKAWLFRAMCGEAAR